MQDNGEKWMTIGFIGMLCLVAVSCMFGDGSGSDPRCDKFKGRSHLACMGGNAAHN